MPLMGWETIVDKLPDLVSNKLQLHAFVALGCEQTEQCWVLDFLPADPTSPVTAAKLLTGGAVQGQFRSKVLKGWIRGPSIRTRQVALIDAAKGVTDLEESVQMFNSSCDPDLRLLRNDCWTYSRALVQQLSGGTCKLDMW
eukprot:CAMPEP_0202908932 /NCGR_PEP_ID=MMETSP1392-20130828/47674_1 /ASSEMBLY_ACC=CAM_ASM_000868 /TAXON_ID=225041 /ORGANISM="Chlamydomonas chlamydogama, Strain SAG 11-48b" /LENGTH=140 /DNA_ID=CAMNT_0049598479 /DNA_START=71 /DNA_END=490 /DNA_ORIENTATION=-